jgi:hypothetical protein
LKYVYVRHGEIIFQLSSLDLENAFSSRIASRLSATQLLRSILLCRVMLGVAAFVTGTFAGAAILFRFMTLIELLSMTLLFPVYRR